MARVVRSKAADIEADWYVPDLPGYRLEDGTEMPANRDDPNPMRLRLRPVTYHEMNRLKSSALEILRRKGQQMGDAAVRMQHAVIEECVLEVEGYSVQAKDGSVLEPKTGADLVKAALAAPPEEGDALLGDILAALNDHSRLADGLEKKLRQQRVSGSQDTRPGNGAAPSAKGPSGSSTTSGAPDATAMGGGMNARA